MAYRNINRTLSLSANYYNVSVFRESWLLAEKVLEETDIDTTKSFFSPNIVHIKNDRFELVIHPPELRISLQNDAALSEYSIAEKIVKRLPHIPYVDVDLLSVYLIDDFDYTLGKTLFFNEKNKVFLNFKNSEEDPRFGAYLSKDFLNSRLKLDIKPVTAIEGEDDKTERTFLQVECLLSKEISENDSERCINEVIRNSESFYNYCEEIIQQF